MNFQEEMRQMFLRVAAGEAEPAEWGDWWSSHESELKEILTRGDRTRIMSAFWHADYYWMTKTQAGIAYYFRAQGRPVKLSGYYEVKAQEEKEYSRQRVLNEYYKSIEPARQRWEKYLEGHSMDCLIEHPAGTSMDRVMEPSAEHITKHLLERQADHPAGSSAKRPTGPMDFDWRSLLGTPPGQKPAESFSYKEVRSEEQWKECREELQLRLKENMQAKIMPLAKAYGMKKAGPKTFVKETNGLVSCIKFIGYFRGGGYEDMVYYLCPIYALEYGILGLPGHICQGEAFQKMDKDWGVIQYGTVAVDADMVEKINGKFDDILTFLADGVLPEWQKIDSLETYFAKERQDYLKAAAKGPKDPWTGRLMWGLDQGAKNHPWLADEYLFGVWDLLSGREEEGYARLEECMKRNDDFVQDRLRERPDAYNDSRDPITVMYHNAELFARTKQIADAGERRRGIRETYEEVCRFMRYYHKLAKRTERA